MLSIPGTGFPGGSVVKNPPTNARECGFDPRDGMIPLEKEMATHSSILGWEIPLTGEPRGLQSTGSQIVRHDLETKQNTTTMPGIHYFIIP